MNIFNKEVKIRDYVCSPTGGYKCDNQKVNLYINVSSYCPAKCEFCNGYKEKKKIDFSKLKEVITELHSKQVINRISLTGGEPLSDLKILDQVLKTISDVCGKDEYHVSLNTCGINLFSIKELEYTSVLNDVHISRHSINDKENNKIFGIKTPTIEEIKREIELRKEFFSFSCNLIRGIVDSSSRLKDYLDTAIDIGIYQVGFVSLMNKTDICEKKFIDFEDITNKLRIRDGFLFDTMAKDTNSCKCENYQYINELGEISIYFRRVIGNVKSDCVKMFVYDLDNNLITNFGKDMILL